MKGKPRTRTAVNVLIMANNSNINNNGANAEELRNNQDESIELDEIFDEIDLTAASDDSDSELDINALLKKYMPEYSEDAEETQSGGVLSRIKKTAESEKNDDEKLMNALDSAFSSGEDVAYAEEYSDEYEDEYYDEYEDEYEDGGYEYEDGDILDDPYADEEPVKKMGFFAKLKAKKAERAAKKAAKLEEQRQYEEYGEELCAEEEYADQRYVEEQHADDVEYADYEGYEEVIDEAEGEVFEETTSEPEYVDEYAELFGGDEQAADLAESYEAAEETPAEPEYIDEYAELFGDAVGEAEEAPVEEYSEAEEATEVTEAPADEAEDEITEEDIAALDDEFDPTDINLMVAFGLDNGEDDKADRAKAFGDKLVEKQKNRGPKTIKLDRPEFVDKTQIPQIRAEYKKKTTALWIKLGVCGIVSILLLIFENIAAISKLFTGAEQQFAGAFDPAVYPTVYAMVSLQLMLIACLCAFDQIVDGVKSLLCGVPKPETITALLAVCGVLYSAIIPRLVVAPEEPAMFNFVVALAAFLSLVYAMFNHKREMMNFRVIANKRPKHIVRRLNEEESECETQAFSDADDICDVMKIEKTDFIDGFYGRLSKPDATTNTFITFLMSVTAALAVLIGIFAAFKGCSAAEVGGVIFSSLLILIPLSVFLTFSYPFYRANLSAKEHDSAIIGETSLEEYSNASIISFDDKNVFPSYSVKVQNIRIYNNARIDRVLYYASSVFAYAGGPLQDVFEVATKEMGNSQNVQIFDIEDGFLATQVDGVNITFGSCEALTERGLEIPQNAAEDDVDLSDELSIMYMFRESKLVAKMYIQYVMDPDIDLILKQYSGSGLYVCVRTFDPNINERMIARKLNLRRIPLKIIRYADAEEAASYEEKVDSGLVTCASPKSLLQIISYCGKVLHTKKTNIAMSTLSIMIGVAILALLLITNATGVVNSLFIALYQLLWTVPMVISTRMFVR